MRNRALTAFTLALAVLLVRPALGDQPVAQPNADEKKDDKKPEPFSADTFAGLELRGIGPALTSGRVVDLAVHPDNPAHYYVAVACGGVWKTTNSGTTWTPVFDRQVSYSIGTVVLDPKNPNVVWVGTGENNSQRSVGYGDGVYRSEDGGKSWKKMGLDKSEHIGKIVIDPRDSKVVYVAAQGPLWGPGGDRGLYKTTDAGATWKAVLTISENTGVSDLVYDPRDPDVLYAAAYQRRRHVWTLVDGGPESAIHKSTDGGATWKKLESGLPKQDLGRIGLAISPVAPDTLYAIVEAFGDAGGIFRSTDRGASWEKRGKYLTTSAQYYSELVADPFDADRLYSMDTYLKVSDDGGKTWRNLGEKSKHVDNHAMWIDPRQPDHYLVGCDGGVYESFDRGATWGFKANLSITQFYRVTVDNVSPVYNVYGGTQDNFSLGGPSRTLTQNGAMNTDWFVTQGGDGFWSQVDPEDPNIVYAEAQYGELTRFDRKSGENVDIVPQPGPGEPGLRWNWDSPLLISSHAHTRLYFAANKLFRSDDRGNTWKAISPDLTRQIDRNQLKVFGKVPKADAVAKNASTSLYGNIVALAESPKVEGVLYVGTDDGLVQVTEDGGANWRKIESFPGVPANTYVSKLLASQHDAGTVYAAFDNHKMSDFAPYVLKSTDRGKSWVAISSDLPKRGSVNALAEDTVQPNLLFAGTEFGLFFTQDGGKKWIQLKGGLPPIAIKDIAIQKREGDLVLATFGRGFYILDDYSPLRLATAAAVESEALTFPVKRTAAYIPTSRIGGAKKGFLGESFFLAPNPPFGAVFTYYLKDELKTKKAQRYDLEKKDEKAGKTPPFPSFDSLRAEAREEEPAVILTVSDSAGNVVRRLTGPTGAGIHRVAWDLRYPPANPTDISEKEPDDEDDFYYGPIGPLAVPATYTVALSKRVEGKETPLAEPQSFEVYPLGLATLPASDQAALVEFQKKTARLQRAVLGSTKLVGEIKNRLAVIRAALEATPAAPATLRTTARELGDRLYVIDTALSGDRELRRRNENDAPSIYERVQRVVYGNWLATAAPTTTQMQDYDNAGAAFEKQLTALKQLVEVDLEALESAMESAGAPFTPGRVPSWKKE